jgi:hypothetical protein
MGHKAILQGVSLFRRQTSAFAQCIQANLRHEEFQRWELSVSAGGSAVLICDDGDGHRLYVRVIDWTDFPAPGISFYFCNDTLLLPGEY